MVWIIFLILCLGWLLVMVLAGIAVYLIRGRHTSEVSEDV